MTPPPGPAAPRVASVDAVRGLALVWVVVTASLIAPAAWYDHAPWEGVHPVDGVFPSFVALAGAGAALAARRGLRLRPVVRRAAVLAAAGVAYNAALAALGASGWPGWSALRLTGVLQLFAVVGVALALGHLLTRTARGWLALTGVLAAGHTALLALWAAGCPGGRLTPGCNPSAAVDGALLPARHLYAGLALGHDPEGLVAVAGACVTAAAGAAAGHALLGARERAAAAASPAPPATGAAAVPLLGVVLVLAAGAAATAQAVPVAKRLWTAPFALGVAAAVVAVLVVVHLLLDRPAAGTALRAAAWPLVALGRNSLLVYAGCYLVMAVALRVVLPGDDVPLAVAASEGLAVAGRPQVTWSLLLVVGWTAVAAALHRRRWYLRA